MTRVASAFVAICAFVAGLRKVDDFDTWWHLAAGRWIATHRAIPPVDTLSHTVRDHAWINLQWGFDVLLYALNAAGGPAALSIAAATVFLLTIALLIRLMSVRVGATLALVLALIVVATAQERVSLRPELLSFLLLTAVLWVLDRGRRTDRGLFLLVPLMIAWANVHALFVIGAFAIVCAFIGTARTLPSHRLLTWGSAALASTAINPYGLKGLWFPVKLLSRIDGSSKVFQTVGEFASPFAAGASGTSIIFFKLMLVSGVILAAAAVLLSRRVRAKNNSRDLDFDWGGLICFAGLAVVAAGARRNVAIFAIGTAPFIGRCLEIVLAAWPKWERVVTKRAPIVAAAMAIIAAAAGVSIVTGAFYKFENSPQEFGVGVIEGTFPERAAAFARASRLPPKLYNDMASGGYLAWNDPIGDGVYVDGRLEVYDTPFLTEYVTGVSDQARWQADADRFGIQTAIIFHRFEPDRMLAGRLTNSDKWSLVYVDEVAAVFVRTQGNEAAIARASSLRAEWNARTDAWLSRPVTKWPYPAGRIEGTRAYARFMATIGLSEPAVAAYLRLVDLNISDKEQIERRLLIARYFASNGHVPQAREQAQLILAIDPSNAEAQKLLLR